MIEILNFKALGKGALVANFTVKMHKWGGFLIKDCTLFEAGEKRWINFPARPYEKDGKKKYAEHVGYEDHGMNDRLKAMIMEQLDKINASRGERQETQDDFEIPF